MTPGKIDNSETGAMEVEILRESQHKRRPPEKKKKNKKQPQQVNDMMDFFGGHHAPTTQKNDFPLSSFQRFKSNFFTNGLSLPPSSRLVLGLGLKNGSFFCRSPTNTRVLNFRNSALLEFDFI